MIRCAQCYHFKTKILTIHNIHLDKNFKDKMGVLNRVMERGFVRVWYCIKGNDLGEGRKSYTTSKLHSKITGKEICPWRDNEDT